MKYIQEEYLIFNRNNSNQINTIRGIEDNNEEESDND